jgi:hypothetical protein
VCIQLPDGKEGLYPAAITQIFDIRAHVYAGDEQTDIKNAASAMQLDYGVLMCVRLREGKTLTSEQWQELGKSFAQSRQASLKMRYDTFLVSDTLQKNNFVEKVGPSDSDWAWSIKIHPGVIDAQSLLSILQAKRFDDERVKQMQDFSATIFDTFSEIVPFTKSVPLSATTFCSIDFEIPFSSGNLACNNATLRSGVKLRR